MLRAVAASSLFANRFAGQILLLTRESRKRKMFTVATCHCCRVAAVSLPSQTAIYTDIKSPVNRYTSSSWMQRSTGDSVKSSEEENQTLDGLIMRVWKCVIRQTFLFPSRVFLIKRFRDSHPPPGGKPFTSIISKTLWIPFQQQS